MHQAENWDKLRWIEVEPKVRRKVLHAASCTVALVELSPGAPVGLHSHPHEQVTTVRSGTADFILGDEVLRVGPGDMLRIPSGLEHGVNVLGELPVVLLDFFVPGREDFTASKPL